MSIRRRRMWAGGLSCVVGGLVVLACSAEGADVGNQGGLCTDQCASALNGYCEDSGPGSVAAICPLGTDCTDCGPREDPNAGVGGSGAVGTGGAAAMPTGGTAAVATGGTGAVVVPTGGTGAVVVPTGGTSGGGTSGGDGSSGIIPSDGGNFIKDWDASGAIGAWYSYVDTGGSTLVSTYPDPSGNSDIGSSGGQMCFSGTAVGHHDSDYSTNWGAGVGFNVCAIPDDTSWLPPSLSGETPGTIYSAGSCPTVLSGVNSITFTISGSWPEMRLGFQQSMDESDVSPFVNVPSGGGTLTFSATEASVPDNWDVPNPGAVGTPNVYAIQFQVASDSDDATYEFCLSAITIQ